MKNKILLKSLFVFALIFTISYSTYASEVTGTLSSTGVINNEGGSSSNQGGSISGTVVGGNTFHSSSGGGGSIARNTGSVLGASTGGENSQTMDLSSSYDTTSGTVYSDVIVDNEMNEPFTSTTSSLVADEMSDQTAAVATAYDGLSVSNWIWIILLLFVLIATIIYFYIRSSKDKKQMKHI